MLNKVQSKIVVVTLYGIWTKKDPYYSHQKVWGCPPLKKQTLSNKLEAKSDRTLFVGKFGYSSTKLYSKICLFQGIQSS